jgi:hypothetical protein
MQQRRYDRPLALRLESEFDEECRRGREVIDHDPEQRRRKRDQSITVLLARPHI